jgi:hypothetical protein
MLLQRIKRPKKCHADIPASRALCIRKHLLTPSPERIRGCPKLEQVWLNLFSSRLPEDLLKELAFQGETIEVHGAFWQLCQKHPKVLDFDYLEPISYELSESKYKKISPRYFWGYRKGERRLVVLVAPSPQSVYKHAYFIASYMHYIVGSCKNVIGFNYPDLDDRITDITQLNEEVAYKKDHVILGFAQELIQPMIQELNCHFVSESIGEHYRSKRYQLKGGATLNFLEINFDFMGHNGAHVLRRLVSFGVDSIIYCSRLRSVEGEKDDYARLFSPERYILRSADSPVRYITYLSNPIAKKFQEIASGWHISQDCLESQLEVSGIYCASEISTYDDDLAFFAAAIEDANFELGKKVNFSPLHFACDSLCVSSTLQPFGLMNYDKGKSSFDLMRHYLTRYLSELKKH